MKKRLEILLLTAIVALSSSCNIDEELTTVLPPKIILDSETGIYTVKQGREITIAPQYESTEKATYCWTLEGKKIGSSSSLSFVQEKIGAYYITLVVQNEGGISQEEIRVDVVELEIPTVSIAGDHHQTVAVGSKLKFRAAIRETSLPTIFAWKINDKEVNKEVDYTFMADQIGQYTLTATATNDDGTHSDTINVEVLRAEDMPFLWEFEQTSYHTVVGRKLLIKPLQVSNERDVEYTWTVEEDHHLSGSDAQFVFVADKPGKSHITAVATTIKEGHRTTRSHTFEVTTFEEKAFYRAKNSLSKADWNKVFEYTPAPGQFINELKTGGFDGSQVTPEAAISYAESRLNAANWISLGGFGGYVIVGFDHSIDNTGDYDIGVIGNAFDGSSEPGIVWVMQDENGNGLPDDTWYELAGSEKGKAETIREYAVTYYRPTGAGMPVQWMDNLGNQGQIDYLKQFHSQDYYYPLWVKKDSYTLTGTCLKARNYDQSENGSYWVQPHYDWGYADNFSPSDFNPADKANRFKISNAIDFEGNSVKLSHIDFVKIQCAVQAKSGWLGELSTEVSGFYDYQLKK